GRVGRGLLGVAGRAAEHAARRGIGPAHQCHSSSLFEEVTPMLAVLAEIGQPNFGLIYEPANLLLCGQSYGPDTLAKLQPHLMNVYVQNHRLDEHGPSALTTYGRGEVRYQQLDPWETGGVDFRLVAAGLRGIGLSGFFEAPRAAGVRHRRGRAGLRCALREPVSVDVGAAVWPARDRWTRPGPALGMELAASAAGRGATSPTAASCWRIATSPTE